MCIMYRFQDWIKSQNLKEDTTTLFEESIKCCQVEAYKAALLFSFIGFQQIIRERMLNSDIPESFNSAEKRWENEVISSLKNDDRYEMIIGKYILSTPKDSDIFKLNNNIKNQYEYWKNRRNECAHGKRATISKEMVTSFWEFIIFNNNHFHVDGGINILLNNLEVYLDDSRTSSNIKAVYIGEAVSGILNSNELDIVFKILNEKYNTIAVSGMIDENDERIKLIANVFEELLKLKAPYREATKQYLYTNLPLLINCIYVKPEITHFIDEKETVRFMWKEELFKQKKISLKVICNLLVYDKVPKNQIEELAEYIFKFYYEFSVEYLTEKDIEILKDRGVAEKLRVQIFEKEQDWRTQFTEATNKRNIITLCLESAELSKVDLDILFEVFEGPYPPFNLRDTINIRLKSRKSFLEKLKNELLANGVKNPKDIDL